MPLLEHIPSELYNYIMDSVLLLSTSFEPFKIVSWQKAMQLLFQKKVEVLEEYDREIKTVSLTFRLPSVLKLKRFVPLRSKKTIIRFSRTNIFIRDQHNCQYCGRKRSSHELTLDHVIPVVQGGLKSWENIVTACIQCNQRKGGRTPAEASMRLICKPKAPSWLPSATLRYDLNSAPEHWKLYLSWNLSKTSQRHNDPS
jgi:5-methylcytosine-specific restriction endonuclease McrA